MKKKVLSILFLLLCISSFAQYESFFGKNSTKFSFYYPIGSIWKYDDDYLRNAIIGYGCNYCRYFNATDTITINDYQYYKTQINVDINIGSGNEFWCEAHRISNNTPPYYLREDTTNGKLFLYAQEINGSWVNDEILICDMSLSVGDTFYIPYVESWANGTHYFHDLYPNYFNMGGDHHHTSGYPKYIVVDSINYINNKKVIYFSHIVGRYITEFPSQNLPYNEWKKEVIRFIFVEGVGPIYAADGLLLCLEKDDTLTYMTNPFLGCQQWGYPTGGGNVKDSKKQELKILLNAESTALTIVLPEEFSTEKGEIYIFDIIGRVLIKKVFSSNPQIINISNFKQGIYIVNFQSNKYHISNKFLKPK